jgi:hypothetical protein
MLDPKEMALGEDRRRRRGHFAAAIPGEPDECAKTLKPGKRRGVGVAGKIFIQAALE